MSTSSLTIDHIPEAFRTTHADIPKVERNLHIRNVYGPSDVLSSSSPAEPEARRSKKDKSKHKHKSCRSKKHKSRSSRSRKHQFAAYTLQLIGILCLVLAALKTFEPLAGIGFTLVVIGYDGGKRYSKGKAKKGDLFEDVLRSVMKIGEEKENKMPRRKPMDIDDNGEDIMGPENGD